MFILLIKFVIAGVGWLDPGVVWDNGQQVGEWWWTRSSESEKWGQHVRWFFPGQILATWILTCQPATHRWWVGCPYILQLFRCWPSGVPRWRMPRKWQTFVVVDINGIHRFGPGVLYPVVTEHSTQTKFRCICWQANVAVSMFVSLWDDSCTFPGREEVGPPKYILTCLGVKLKVMMSRCNSAGEVEKSSHKDSSGFHNLTDIREFTSEA